jgi:hypothetical protein
LYRKHAKAAKIAAGKKPPVPSDSDDSSLEPEMKVPFLNNLAAEGFMVDLPPGFKVFDSDSSEASSLTPLSPEVTKQAGGGEIVLTPPDDIEAVTEQTAELSINEVDLDLTSFTIVAKDLEPSIDI